MSRTLPSTRKKKRVVGKVKQTKRSCPAVSQISSLTVLSSTFILCTINAALSQIPKSKKKKVHLVALFVFVCGKPDCWKLLLRELVLHKPQHKTRLAGAHLAEQHNLAAVLANRNLVAASASAAAAWLLLRLLAGTAVSHCFLALLSLCVLACVCRASTGCLTRF